MKIVSVSFFFVLCCVGGLAASDPVKVWVTLRDKGVPSREGFAEDAPLHAPYLDSLEAKGLRVAAALKWQNKVSGRIAPGRLAALRALPMVRSVEEFPRKAPAPPLRPGPKRSGPGLGKPAAPPDNVYASLYDVLGLTRLRDHVEALGKKPGQGVRVAFIDAGFHLGQGPYAHMWLPGRIVDQWDFVDGSPVAAHESLLEDPLDPMAHGQLVLSLLAATGYGFEGVAPAATFLLYRAEDVHQEAYVEEDYVAAAIERAVDSGAQVINISLGYRYAFDAQPDLPYASMDGRTRPASLAALGAARRGVVVSVAMGNNGPSDSGGRPTLSSPADADSILSVGFLDRRDPARPCDYSSGGPTADGRVKPEIGTTGSDPDYYCSVPVVPGSYYDPGYPDIAFNPTGTSLAAPVVTGAVALLRQLHPKATAMQVRDALIATAAGASTPDSLVGFGLMNAWSAHLWLDSALTPRVRFKRPRSLASSLFGRGGGPRDARGRATASEGTAVFRPRE